MQHERRGAHASVERTVGIAAPTDAPEIHRFSHEAMATVFEIYASHPDAAYAAQAARAAFDLIDRLEAELSRFVPNSDITRINHLAAGASTRVGTAAIDCLVIARHMFDLTGGAFDISIGTGLPSLELDPENDVVRATREGVRLDLGGVGKGYAVDMVGELLEEWELGRALVHGGFSSVLALEPPAGSTGWPLTLSDPGRSSHVLARLSARQTALGASGIRKKDHIVDPRTRQPVGGRIASWASVPRPPAPAAPQAVRRFAAAAVTDALTTALMMLGTDQIARLCEVSPGLEAWILLPPDQTLPGDNRLLHFGGASS